MNSLIVVALALLAFLGLPLFAVLGAGGLIASHGAGIAPSNLIVELYRLASQPNLSSIPLFTFAGMVLAEGGGPQRLVKLFDALFGWMPGGLAIVTIISCAFFTAFTGASGVTIIALGGLLYPMLKQSNYGENFTLGLLTSGGSLGLLFPPSLAILIYAIVSGVGVDQLFYAGMVPGAILLVMLSLYSYFTAKHWHVTRSVFSLARMFDAIRTSIWDILLPVLVVTGIFGGFVTVTEAAALTAAYALVLEIILFKKTEMIANMAGIFIDTAKLVGSIMIILGVAMGLTNLLIDSQAPTKLLHLIESHIQSPLQFLLLLNVFLLVVGAMMDIFSAIIVVVPLIAPVAALYQIDPVHLGIIFLANLEIGYLHPPIGLNLFIASQRFNKPILTLFWATLPFLLIMLVWLMMLTYIPSLSLWWQHRVPG